jgi:subtilisin family serine protease
MTKNKIRFRNESFIDDANKGSYLFATSKGTKVIKVLIFSKSGLSKRIKELNKKSGVLKCTQIKDLDNSYELLVPYESREQIASICDEYHKSGLVEYCVPAKEYPMIQINQGTNDPMFIDQWIFDNTGQYSGRISEDIKLDKALTFIDDNNIVLNQEIKVAILDDGVAPNHVDLPYHLFVDNFNLIENKARPIPSGRNTHGTFVAGIISAISNNGVGIRGINKEVKIVNGRIDSQRFNETIAARGIKKAVDLGAKIINLSWGVQERRPMIIKEIEYALAHNVLVVAAAGNYTSSGEEKNVLFPANMDQVLAVGACDQFGRWVNLTNCAVEPGRKKFGSRYGREVDIVAPGISIQTTRYKLGNTAGPGSYDLFDGTSAATAIVTGVASLLLCIKPSLTGEELRTILLSTADDIRGNHSLNDDITFDHMGHGRINALAAVKKVVEMGV